MLFAHQLMRMCGPIETNMTKMVAPLVFRFTQIRGKMHFLNFSQKPSVMSVLKELIK
jgi:hypothetical protein